MSHYAKIADRFAMETAGHQLTVLHDDGLYRHLRFMNPEHGNFYWFDLVTWPGCLTIRGDVGEAYTFVRLPDMFKFFRSRSGRINPDYWSEKLETGRDVSRSYSEELFTEEVAQELTAAAEEYPGIAEAWTAHIESEFDTEHEGEARRALDEFRFDERHEARCGECDWRLVSESSSDAYARMSRHRQETGGKHVGRVQDLTFTFTDTWEWQLRDFDWSFLWACHAIVWGIARYDRIRSYGLDTLKIPQTGVQNECEAAGTSV